MRRPVLLLLAVAMTVSMLAPNGAPVAHACTLPFVPLKEQVANASLIFTGVVVDEFIEPPLDPAVPDDLTHVRMVTFEASEYLKGSGPASHVYPTATSYEFDENGDVVTGQSTCASFGPVGTPHLVLADANGLPQWPPARLDTETGRSFLQQVTAVLQATPTPAPTSAPTPTVAPVSLPDSGGRELSDGPDAAAGLAMGGVLLALAGLCGVWIWRRRQL